MAVHCTVPVPSGRWEIDVTQAPLPLRRSLSRPRSARASLLLSGFFQYISQQDHAPYLISSFPSSFLHPPPFSFPSVCRRPHPGQGGGTEEEGARRGRKGREGGKPARGSGETCQVGMEGFCQEGRVGLGRRDRSCPGHLWRHQRFFQMNG